MHMCTCVCVCVCVCVCTCTYVYECTYLNVCMYRHRRQQATYKSTYIHYIFVLPVLFPPVSMVYAHTIILYVYYKCVCVVTVWGHVCVLLIVNCKFVNLFASVIIIICLYAGMAGTLYFYVDMLANADSACFPALEV